MEVAAGNDGHGEGIYVDATGDAALYEYVAKIFKALTRRGYVWQLDRCSAVLEGADGSKVVVSRLEATPLNDIRFDHALHSRWVEFSHEYNTSCEHQFVVIKSTVTV